MSAIRTIASVFLAMLAMASLLHAEPVTTIRNNGDSANRVDIVVMGDGYTAAEMAKFATDTENAINGLLAQEPFAEYQAYFNIHRVDVVSTQSGADHPETGVYKDTALDATYNCSNIERLICINTTEATNILNNSSLAPDQKDIELVLVNDSKYGGAGGSFAISSVNSSAIEVVLHEIGHSFGFLADEYVSGKSCFLFGFEPSQKNITRQTDRNLIKWNITGGPPLGWIELSTPIPTTGTTAGLPGLYQGANGCASELYRPTYNSKMRSLNNPFEPINEEALITRIYNYVSPIDSALPAAADLTVNLGDSQTFSVNALAPMNRSLPIEWFLDGQPVGTGTTFTLQTAGMSRGIHSLVVEVKDPNPKVLNDSGQLLIDTLTWNVDVRNPLLADMVAPAPGSIINSSEVTFQWTNTGSRGYWLDIGTTLGGFDLYDLGFLASTTSVSIASLPQDGRTLYVRLWTRPQQGSWQYNDYTYTANDANANEGAAAVTTTTTPTIKGGTIGVAWSGIATTTTTDWLGVYEVGASDVWTDQDWVYTNNSAAGSATISLNSPSLVEGGSYEIRLYANDGFIRLATSAPFVLNPTEATVIVATTPITLGGQVTVAWSGLPSPTTTDWVGIYEVGTPDESYLDWRYTNGAANGSLTLDLVHPAIVTGKQYEVRLYIADGYTRMATSGSFILQ